MKNAPAVVAKPNIVNLLAQRFAVNAEQLMPTLKATAFRQQKGEVSDSQMIALMIVANEYGLNPFTKELYAYPDKQGGIVPVVSVDGWNRIVNTHPAFRGVEFIYAEDTETPLHGKDCPVYIECVMRRSDRDTPLTIREYLSECYRPPFIRDDGSVVKGPWQSHTIRMLRHKAFIQCARVAFGFSGVYDDDEAQRILEKDVTEQTEVIRVEGPRSKSAPAQVEGKLNDPRDLSGHWQGNEPAPKAEARIEDTREEPRVPPSTSGRPADASAPEYITEDQVLALDARCTENLVNIDRLKAAAGVQRLAMIETKDYERAVDWLDKVIASRKAKGILGSQP